MLSPLSLFPDWMAELSLQQQAVLVMALRGPDGFEKWHGAKEVLRRYRACICLSARQGRLLVDAEDAGTFMTSDYRNWSEVLHIFREVEDAMPLHFYAHLMHGAQVLAYKHPDGEIRGYWQRFYQQCCEYLHCPAESECAMDTRLNDFGRFEQ